MLNPTIIEKYGKTKEYKEESQSCNDTIISERYECIKIKWFDGEQDIYSDLCGDNSIVFQLSIDEFEGNGHCLNAKLKTIMKRLVGTKMLIGAFLNSNA